jgi:uncharacterized protein (TIGR02588 family)
MAAISCVALMAVLVYLVFDGLNTDDGMADIHLLQGEIVRTDGGYAVEFSALNRSRKSVAAVEIEGELRNGDEILEESRVTLDYLPQRSERNGALSFRRNPQAHEIHLFAGGYTEP